MSRRRLLILTGLALLITGLVWVFLARDEDPAVAPTATPRPVVTSKADLERSKQDVQNTEIDSGADELQENQRDAEAL